MALPYPHCRQTLEVILHGPSGCICNAISILCVTCLHLVPYYHCHACPCCTVLHSNWQCSQQQMFQPHAWTLQKRCSARGHLCLHLIGCCFLGLSCRIIILSTQVCDDLICCVQQAYSFTSISIPFCFWCAQQLLSTFDLFAGQCQAQLKAHI